MCFLYQMYGYYYKKASCCSISLLSEIFVYIFSPSFFSISSPEQLVHTNYQQLALCYVQASLFFFFVMLYVVVTALCTKLVEKNKNKNDQGRKEVVADASFIRS